VKAVKLGVRPRRYKMNKLPKQKITVTQRNLAVIDFVIQFCRQYKIPIGAGLNIHYQPALKDTLNVIVEIVDSPKPTFNFLIGRTSREHPWKVCDGSLFSVGFQSDLDLALLPPTLRSHESKLVVKSDNAGYYQFTATN